MHRIIRTLLAGTFLFGIVPAAAQAPGQPSAVLPADCDRACLIDHARAYMAALAARDPARLPLAPDVRFTENNVEMPLGEGLWGTVTEVAAEGLEVADAETGNAAWFGYVREHGEPAIFAMRMRVERGRISEVETVVHRNTGLPAPFGDVTAMVHDPAFQEVLPPEQRRSRERLIAVAQSYFNTVELNDGMVFAPFDEDCGRLENGISTTASTGGGAAAIAQGCEEQFKLGLYRINKRVRERRFPLVDVERGIVVASGFFDHANEFDRYLLTDGREMKTALKWPNSISLLEAFRVKDGRIHRIEAVFTYVPYFKHNPWETSLPILAGPDLLPRADSAAAAPAPECDRPCLTGVAQTYMAALVAKDPARAEWADTVRFSENGVALMIGDGLWGSVSGHGRDPLIVADPRTGNVAWIGTVAEHGQEAFYAMRIQVEGRRIATVETIVRRKEGRPPFGDPAAFRPDRSLTAPLAAAARMPRARMEALVQGYYNSLERNDGTVLTRFAPDCTRIENGVAMTGGTQGDCEQQVAAARFRYIDRVRDRQVPVIDEERGLVVAFNFRDQSAREQNFTAKDGTAYTAETHYPLSYGVVSLFKLDGDRIRRIEEVASETSYLSAPPWGR